MEKWSRHATKYSYRKTYYKSLHSSQSTTVVVPSAEAIVELGLVPSLCSIEATTQPLLAISPQSAEYINREVPTP